MKPKNIGSLSASKSPGHVLHLYSSSVDKYLIHRSFLVSLKEDENAVVVSSDDPEIIRRELSFVKDRLRILSPETIASLETEIGDVAGLRLIIDAGSFPTQTEVEIGRRERYLAELADQKSLRCLCTYRVNGVSAKMIRHLSKVHGQLQLTTSDLTLISGDFMQRSPVSSESIRKHLRDNLEAIILALIQEKSMTGLDIIETINLEFSVLLSPGAVYPLLNSLQKRGLLTSMREGKERRYEPAEESKLQIRHFVFEQIQARNLLNKYLQKKIALKEPGISPGAQLQVTKGRSIWTK